MKNKTYLKHIILISLLFVISIFAYGQDNPIFFKPGSSAALELNSTNKGFLVPRLTTNQINLVSTPATGLLLYNIDDNCFWVKETATWKRICNTDNIYDSLTTFNQQIDILQLTDNNLRDSINLIIDTIININNRLALITGTLKDKWDINGNSGTDPNINFIGTLDNKDLSFRTNNIENIKLFTNGNIDIGINNPSSLVSVQNLKILNGFGNNYIFSSNATGLGSWKQLNFSLNSGILSLTSHNAQIDLSTLYTAGTGINITGTTITNIGDLDNTNELQNLSLSNNTLSISNGNNVNLSSYLDNTDNQTLSINNNDLTISNGNTLTLPTNTAGTGINITSGIITNTAPDKTVSLTGSGATSVTGTYPNFTITTTDHDNQSLALNNNLLSINNGNSVNLSSYLDNTDQQELFIHDNELAISNGNTVTLPIYTQGVGIEVSHGVISNTAPDRIIEISSGAGISVSGTYPDFTITNLKPDQSINITGTGATTVTGTYPNYTVNSVNSTYSASTGLLLSGTTFFAQTTTALWNANRLQGSNVSSIMPITGQILKYNGNSWIPSADNNTTYIAGTGLSLAGTTFSAQTTTALWNANKLQGKNISSIAPTAGQVLKYIQGVWKPAADNTGTYQAGTGISINEGIIYNTGDLNNTNELQSINFDNTTNTLNISGITGVGASALIPNYWSKTENDISNNNTGNVGIGNTNPQEKLDVAGNVRINDNTLYLRSGDDKNHGLGWYGGSKTFAGIALDGPILFGYNGGMLGIKKNSEKCVLRWDDVGRVAIGSNAPTEKLHIQDGCLKFSGTFSDVVHSWTPIIKSKSGTAWCSYNNNGGFVSSIGLTNTGLYYMNESFDYPFQVSPAGYVLLTVANEETALAVYSKNAHKRNFIVNGKGEIYARKVIVRLQDWGDFVFAHDYELSPLTKVEKYIKENCHLLGVPSAAEVEDSGLDIGEMNKILVQKVEELTLYLIDQQKQINELKVNNNSKKP